MLRPLKLISLQTGQRSVTENCSFATINAKMASNRTLKRSEEENQQRIRFVYVIFTSISMYRTDTAVVCKY